jgi:hypothetical protein
MTSASLRRWDELLANVAALIPVEQVQVLVDGDAGQPADFADRLTAWLTANGRPDSVITLAGTDSADPAGPAVPAGSVRDHRENAVVIWLRSAPRHGHHANGESSAEGEKRGASGEEYGEAAASIVIDLHDPDWPVIRRVARPRTAPATDGRHRMAADRVRRRDGPVLRRGDPPIGPSGSGDLVKEAERRLGR